MVTNQLTNRNLHDGNDVNHDGFVSWKEYVATTYGLGFVDNEQQAPEDGEFDYREMILRDYNKFITADANGGFHNFLEGCKF